MSVKKGTVVKVTFTRWADGHQLALYGAPHLITAKHDVSVPANRKRYTSENSSFHIIYLYNHFLKCLPCTV